MTSTTFRIATPEEYERRMRELRPHTEAERERLRQQVRVSPGFMRTTFRRDHA